MSSEVLDKIIQLMTAAFGLVAALAWNTAIQALFTRIFGTSSGLAAQFFYATVVTVFVTIRLSRIAERIKKDEEEEESTST